MRRRITRSGVLLAGLLLVTGCQGDDPGPGGTGAGAPELPADPGALPVDAVTWATGETIHVGDRVIRAGRPVRAMVVAGGRVYFVARHSDQLRVSDGSRTRRTGYETDELRTAADGRYLAFLDQARMPWSTVVVDLVSGQEVVRDDAGMGDADDDLTDLYEDAEPRMLGFEGDELFTQTPAGVLSWDPVSGERTEHDDAFFADPLPGGGRELPALVRQGRLVVPRDPYRSTQYGDASPDGSVTVQPVDGGERAFDVRSGRELRVDLTAEHLIVGGWTGPTTVYGVAFDGRAFGPRTVRLVSCQLVDGSGCKTLRRIRLAPHQLVLFPTGSPATDY